MPRKGMMCAAAIAVAVVMAAAAAPARGAPSREYQLKAAFLYNFVQFVEWPAAAFENEQSPYVIAVVGENPFDGAIEAAVNGKTINGRSLVVRYFPNVADLGPCHLLFVARSENGRLAELMEKLGGSAVLTVGESEQFPWAGGCIRFLNEDNKIRFEVNLEAAERARIRISAKLLKLAKIFKK